MACKLRSWLVVLGLALVGLAATAACGDSSRTYGDGTTTGGERAGEGGGAGSEAQAGTSVGGGGATDAGAGAGGGGSGAEGGSSGANNGLPTIASGQAKPTGIALTDSDVYWATWGDGVDGSIWHCPKSGCGDSPPEVVISGLPRLRSIALVQSTLYWVDAGDPAAAAPPQVMQCELAACSAGQALGFVPNPGSSYFHVAANEERVYVAGFGAVLSCPVTGCTQDSQVIAINSGGLRGVAATADDDVYATSWGGRQIVHHCPLAGCVGNPGSVLNAPEPFAVALDATNIYWSQFAWQRAGAAQPPQGLEPSDVDSVGGSVRTCSLAGCDAASSDVVVSGDILPFGLAVDATALFYTDFLNGLVVRVPKDAPDDTCEDDHFLRCENCLGLSRCDGSCSRPDPIDLGEACGCDGTIVCDGSCTCHNLQVDVAGIDGAVGTVSSEALAFECTSSCTTNVNGSASVSFTATPGAGFYFAGWKGACASAGLNPVCELALTDAGQVSISAEFSPANVMFWTSTSYTLPQLAMKGSGATTLSASAILAGADLACEEIALSSSSLAPADGHYRAWLSSSAQTVVARLSASGVMPRGWVRVDGKPIVDRIPEDVDQHTFYPVSLNERGIPGSVLTLSGTTASGRQSGVSCSNWTSASANQALSVGSSDSALWADSTVASCAAAHPLLCLQTDYVVRAAPTISQLGPLKWAFALELTPGTLRGGLAALDGACEAAGDRVEPGTYRALVATSAGSAASRFTSSGSEPYVRLDGVVVAAPASDLLASPPQMLAPLSVAAASPYEYRLGELVFTGANSPTSPGAIGGGPCGDWTTSGSTDAGSTSSSGSSFFSIGSYSCPTTAAFIYCLED